MNFSFAEACFRMLAQELSSGEAADRYVMLIVSPGEQGDLVEEIEVSLERKKLATFHAEASNEGPVDVQIIGDLPDHLGHPLVSVRPSDTNEILAGRLDPNLTTYSNRTDKLAKLRLLRKRRRQGALGYKQFEFFPVLGRPGRKLAHWPPGWWATEGRLSQGNAR